MESAGKTVEAATEEALRQLGVGPGEAEVQVLVEPKLGLFGRVRTEARVRARVRPLIPRSADERRERRRRPPRGQRSKSHASGSGETKSVEAGSQSVSPGVGVSEEAMLEQEVSQQEVATVAEEFLIGLLARLGVKGTVESVVDDEFVNIAVTGDNLGFLVGPRGTSLAAIQEITRTVVQRRSGSHGRIAVDIAGYRARRRTALEDFTKQLASEVLDSGVERELEPMGASDRKVVHDTVNGISGLGSRSEGDEPRRRVVIFPVAGINAGED